MLLNSPTVDRLVEAFRRLPGIGRRSAERLALYLLAADKEDAAALSKAILNARESVHRCSVCRNLTETDPCKICTDDRRDQKLICVVEQPSGTMAIESGGSYRGTYHVLHGVLSPLDGVGPDELDVDGFVQRVQGQSAHEVIIATNATAEGEATAMYLARQLQAVDVRVTRIAHGVPMGSGLEFADNVTLSHALDGRTEM